MEILVVDIETTGFATYSDAIVEIGIVLVDTTTKKIDVVFDKIVKDKKFDSKKHKNAWIFQNTDIKLEDVENASPLDEHIPELQGLFDRYPMTAYNKSFDIRFLSSYGLKMNDIKCLLKSCHPHSLLLDKKGNKKRPSVEEIYRQFFCTNGEEYIEKHRAGADAIDEGKILLHLVELKTSNPLIVDEPSKPKKEKEPMGPKDTFKFGKFKHMVFSDVVKKHSAYVDWCLENVNGFAISDEARKLLKPKAQPSFD